MADITDSDPDGMGSSADSSWDLDGLGGKGMGLDDTETTRVAVQFDIAEKFGKMLKEHLREIQEAFVK